MRKRAQGMLWIARHPMVANVHEIVYYRDIADSYAKQGWEVEGPYVPGRQHNPMSPRAIRDRLNGFRKD